MKKTFISLLVVSVLFLTSCGGDNAINSKYLNKNFDKDTLTLDLSNKKLTVFPDFSQYGTGEVFMQAKIINLSNNSLLKIDSEALKGFSEIETLDLSFNTYKWLKSSDLKLNKLVLNNNQIEKIGLSNSTIKELDLSNNLLSFGSDIELPASLNHLNLSHNLLQNIDGFEKLKFLKYLNLENNKLKDKNLGALKNSNNIKFLGIINNQTSSTRTASIEKFNQKYLEKLGESQK